MTGRGEGKGQARGSSQFSVLSSQFWFSSPVFEPRLRLRFYKDANARSLRRKERDPFGALRLLRAGSFARLAQIPFGFAQGRLSRRKERLFGMTRSLHLGRCSYILDT